MEHKLKLYRAAGKEAKIKTGLLIHWTGQNRAKDLAGQIGDHRDNANMYANILKAAFACNQDSEIHYEKLYKSTLDEFQKRHPPL